MPNYNGTILIVDDIPTNLSVLMEFLQDTGYKILVATDGESAIEQAEYALPDIILLDVIMPGIDGFELLRRVHAVRPGLPIILITGYPETLQRLPTLGGTNPRLFTKPFQGPELLAAISESLRQPAG